MTLYISYKDNGWKDNSWNAILDTQLENNRIKMTYFDEHCIEIISLLYVKLNVALLTSKCEELSQYKTVWPTVMISFNCNVHYPGGDLAQINLAQILHLSLSCFGGLHHIHSGFLKTNQNIHSFS